MCVCARMHKLATKTFLQFYKQVYAEKKQYSQDGIWTQGSWLLKSW